jgi:drug/metabolite transporter (DMT)-like permease
VIRDVRGDFTPGALSLLRFLIASSVVLIYGFVMGIRWPQKRDLFGIFLCGICGVTCYHIFLNTGLQHVDSGSAAFLTSTAPVFTVLIARFYLKEKLSLLGWLGIFISFSGVPFIALTNDGPLVLNPYALLIVAGTFLSTIYFNLQKPYLSKYTSLEFTTYIMISGTLCMLFYVPELWSCLQTAPQSSILKIVYLGVLPGALAYVLWTKVQSSLPISRTASFMYLILPMAVFFGWLFLDEMPKPLAFVGAALALTGVVIVNRARVR